MAGAQAPVLLWPDPLPIPYLAPLSAVQLKAVAVAGAPVAVPLDASFNRSGITTIGSFDQVGFDQVGRAFPAELIGTSVSWRGVRFGLGPADAASAISSVSIPLPAGSYGTLLMLGAMVNGEQPPTAVFRVHYGDGSIATATLSMSDWALPMNYAGESVVECFPFRHYYKTGIERYPACVYGYEVAIDPAKQALSVELPADAHVALLAMAMVPPGVPGAIAYAPGAGTRLPEGGAMLTAEAAGAQAAVPLTVAPLAAPLEPEIVWPMPEAIVEGTPLGGTQLNARAMVAANVVPVPLGAYARVNAIAADGVPFLSAGLDGTGSGGTGLAYGGGTLGTAVSFAGGSLPLGEAGVPDAATSTVIALPAVQAGMLLVVGTGVSGAQAGQVFRVGYADGTAVDATLSLSDWKLPQGFAGETIVRTMTYADSGAGGRVSGSFNVYGYQIPVDASRTLSSLTLPANGNVVVMALGYASLDGPLAVAGTFAYQPGAGAVLDTGTQGLSVVFQPADAEHFRTVSAGNAIQVLEPEDDFTLRAIDAGLSVAYGGHSAARLEVAPVDRRYGGPITFSVVEGTPEFLGLTFAPAAVGRDDGQTGVVLTADLELLSGVWGGRVRGGRVQGSRVEAWWALLAVPLLGLRKRRKSALLGLLLLLGGCGSGYRLVSVPVMVRATDGRHVHTVPLTLTLMPPR